MEYSCSRARPYNGAPPCNWVHQIVAAARRTRESNASNAYQRNPCYRVQKSSNLPIPAHHRVNKRSLGKVTARHRRIILSGPTPQNQIHRLQSSLAAARTKPGSRASPKIASRLTKASFRVWAPASRLATICRTCRTEPVCALLEIVRAADRDDQVVPRHISLA
jgi:hypothetical protein